MKAVRITATIIVSCGVLAACGSAAGTATGTGLTDKSPTQIAQAAKDAVAKAHSVHLKGNISSNGVDYALDLVVNSPKGLDGTMALSGKGSFVITTVDGGTFYLKPDQQFWTTYGGSDPAVLQVLNGKCITVTSADSGFGSLVSGFSSLTDLGQIFSKPPLSNPSTLSKGPTVTVNGQPAIELKAADGTTVDVAGQGTAYPLRFSKSGPSGGKIDFDRWDSAGTITAPSGCKSLSDLAGAAPTPTP